MSILKSGAGNFRYGRGAQKFGNSWDAQKMREREEARRRKRMTKEIKDLSMSELGQIMGRTK